MSQQFAISCHFPFLTFHCGSSIYLHLWEWPAVHPCLTTCTDQTQHQKADGCTGAVGAGVNVFIVFSFVASCCPHLSVPIGLSIRDFALIFLVLIIKTNCIFLEELRVCVFTVSAWLPGTVSLAVAASSQKPASPALPSSTPVTSECCRLGGKKKLVHGPKGARIEICRNTCMGISRTVSTRWCLKMLGLEADVKRLKKSCFFLLVPWFMATLQLLWFWRGLWPYIYIA